MTAFSVVSHNALKNAMNNVLFRSVVSGLAGYFLYPNNDALVRLVRRNDWLRFVFLFLLIWQSPTGGSFTRTAIATAIVFAVVYLVIPTLDNLQFEGQ